MTTAAELAGDLGLDVTSLAKATGADPGRIVVRPMPALVGALLAPWVAAMTWRRTIYVRSGTLDRRLLVHELAHAGQWHRRPWLFLPLYGAAFVRGAVRERSWRRGYEAIPAEVAARETAAAWQ